MNKLKEILKKILLFIVNPRLLLCVGIAWMITNGWSYVALGIGTWFHINWLTVVSTAYLAALWFPFTPEKIVTFAIALWLLKLLFPNDKKTLGVLKELKEKALKKIKKKK